MTTPFRRRPKHGRRIVAVSDHWRVAGATYRRQVTVLRPDGALVPVLLPDDHPALVAFLERAAAAVAA